MSLHLVDIPHLSPSGASTLQTCERRYWWQYNHGLGRDERSEAMAMGSGLAAALEHGNLGAGITEYERNRPKEDGWTDPDAFRREWTVAFSIIREAWSGYLQRWPDEDTKREQTYLVRLDDVDPVLQVRIDGVVPGSHLIEDKLRSASSMRAEALENEVRQGRQLTAEIWGHWRATGELLPVHFRVIKKPDPRPLKKVGLDDIPDLVAEHFTKDGVFNEFFVERSEGKLKEFEQEFTALAARAEGLLGGSLFHSSRNTDACFKYGRTCPALAVCQGLASPHTLFKESQ